MLRLSHDRSLVDVHHLQNPHKTTSTTSTPLQHNYYKMTRQIRTKFRKPPSLSLSQPSMRLSSVQMCCSEGMAVVLNQLWICCRDSVRVNSGFSLRSVRAMS